MYMQREREREQHSSSVVASRERERSQAPATSIDLSATLPLSLSTLSSRFAPYRLHRRSHSKASWENEEKVWWICTTSSTLRMTKKKTQESSKQRRRKTKRLSFQLACGTITCLLSLHDEQGEKDVDALQHYIIHNTTEERQSHLLTIITWTIPATYIYNFFFLPSTLPQQFNYVTTTFSKFNQPLSNPLRTLN
jgi:hypothetical protein